MNEESFNISIRKFLKMVGVSSQREIEQAVAKALQAGSIAGNAELPARMTLEITTPTVMRASARRSAAAGEVSRCNKIILRPQATWATIAIGPTQ